MLIIIGVANGGNSNPKASQPVVSASSASTQSTSTKQTSDPVQKQSASQPDFTIKVTGSSGLPFSGDVMVASSDGSSNSETISASVPKTITIQKAAMISVVFQNQGATGSFNVAIYHDGTLVKEGSTSSQYGAVTVASQLY
ncbi:hypothetical protein NZD89_05330 [Alicyclobacillus fastidiosus]|uniref:Uncharacterized protein n=1 Tax=Alicyclobacillus fastidiosus TaxID=392011 RepID=A0ABY6ZJ21_9BACL|nr:hypothetical protein [Alicyclobacillus fastidiosus]WAH42852.1 hypothetical protein NZD89_05330 [Alicyclobacillus fastidiosus]